MIVSPRLTPAQRVYLDFVRAAAALAVLLGHASAIFLQGGWLEQANIQVGAVPVFFLISGFLISLSVFQKHADRSYGFGDYFIDRFCRIYCAFVPALVFVAMVDAFVLHKETYEWAKNFTVQSWFGDLLMMQDFPLFQVARRLGVPDNKWFVTQFGSAGPFWTISIEWWIYMLFGFVAYFRFREDRKFHGWYWLVIGFLAIEPFYHFVGGPDRCLTMLWVLGMGAGFFYLRLPVIAAPWRMKPKQWRSVCVVACGLALFAMIAHHFADKFHAENTAAYHEIAGGITEFQMGVYLAVALFALLFACGTFARVPGWLDKPISFVANYSYSLYLTHSTILVLMEALFAGKIAAVTLYWATIALSNIVAILFWWLFERHHRAVAGRLRALKLRMRALPVGQSELT